MLFLCAHSVAVHPRIKHVVVLYEENRAFDHFFGWQTSLNVDGLKGDETNPVDLNDASRGSVKVFPGAPYVAKEQPRHDYAPYQTKLDIVNGTPRMDGFVDYERSVHPWWRRTPTLALTRKPKASPDPNPNQVAPRDGGRGDARLRRRCAAREHSARRRVRRLRPLVRCLV